MSINLIVVVLLGGLLLVLVGLILLLLSLGHPAMLVDDVDWWENVRRPFHFPVEIRGPLTIIRDYNGRIISKSWQIIQRLDNGG